mmetsp:Transcript_42352/g.95691  ORF Transcript_42352/g.95691 Transcript_42352/m.95691 type:complete len:207 (-) Transcript_42352:2053-2673(-)
MCMPWPTLDAAVHTIPHAESRLEVERPLSGRSESAPPTCALLSAPSLDTPAPDAPALDASAPDAHAPLSRGRIEGARSLSIGVPLLSSSCSSSRSLNMSKRAWRSGGTCLVRLVGVWGGRAPSGALVWTRVPLSTPSPSCVPLSCPASPRTPSLLESELLELVFVPDSTATRPQLAPTPAPAASAPACSITDTPGPRLNDQPWPRA